VSCFNEFDYCNQTQHALNFEPVTSFGNAHRTVIAKFLKLETGDPLTLLTPCWTGLKMSKL
jgi:hypothetical protein